MTLPQLLKRLMIPDDMISRWHFTFNFYNYTKTCLIDCFAKKLICLYLTNFINSFLFCGTYFTRLPTKIKFLLKAESYFLSVPRKDRALYEQLWSHDAAGKVWDREEYITQNTNYIVRIHVLIGMSPCLFSKM